MIRESIEMRMPGESDRLERCYKTDKLNTES